MPLGTRDILLVIRAKDAASHVVLGLSGAFGTLAAAQQAAAMKTMIAGSALLGLGAATAGIGALGISVLKGWTDEAIKYRQQSALTLTQVGQLGVSLGDIEQIGLRVATSVPVAFDQIQASLYDIFSSMDVSVADAEVLLKGFARAAVAGQTDIQTAGRATIALMNAYKLPVSELNDVLDFQFRLVQKGVGTYEEFAKTIGRAIPSARRAGQEYTTLGGVLAFLTRNGLSTAMAATSAARAMDSLAHPTVQKRLADMGISVYDLSGGFRQIDDVAADLGKKLAPLTDPEKAKALQELFKGAGGTIQARRFWDLAIRNFDELNQRVDEMINKSGSLEEAYKLMFDQPATQAQLLDNRLQALKISFGQALIPVFMEAVKWISKLVGFFNDLDPGVKATIAKFALLGFTIMTVVGIIMAIVGAFLLFLATIQLLGGIGAIISMMSGLGIALALLAAAAYLVYRNWDTLWAWGEKYWPMVRDTAIGAWKAIYGWAEQYWPVVRDFALNAWNSVYAWGEENWPKVRDFAIESWNAVKTWAETNWPIVRDAVVNAWNEMLIAVQTTADWFQTQGPAMMEQTIAVWQTLGGVVQLVWDILHGGYEWIVNTFGPGFMNVWNSIAENVGPIIAALAEIIGRVAYAIGVVIAAIVRFMAYMGVWEAIWATMRSVVEFAVNNIINVWNLCTSLIAAGVAAIRYVLEGLAALLRGDFSGAWTALQGVISAVWAAIVAVVQFAVGTIQNIITLALSVITAVWSVQWNVIRSVLSIAWSVMQTIVSVAMSAIQSIVMTAIGVLRGVWNAGWTLIMNITTTAVNVIRAVLNGLALIFQAIQSALNTLKGVWSSVWGAIAGAIGGIVGTIVGALGGIISVLSKIVSMAGAAAGALRNLAGQAAAGIPIIGPGISIIGGFLGGQKGITNVPPGSSFFAGEAGTELITLHGRGATVLTANKTAMAGNSSTGPLVGTLNVYGGQGTPAEIREAVEDALMAVVDRDRARRPH